MLQHHRINFSSYNEREYFVSRMKKNPRGYPASFSLWARYSLYSSAATTEDTTDTIHQSFSVLLLRWDCETRKMILLTTLSSYFFYPIHFISFLACPLDWWVFRMRDIKNSTAKKLTFPQVFQYNNNNMRKVECINFPSFCHFHVLHSHFLSW